MAKKPKTRPPRRKRLSRAARLIAGRQWLATFTGSHVVRAYARWFGVDLGCALKELQLLSVQLDPTYVAALRETLQLRQRSRREATPAGTSDFDDSDVHFAYIAGYTEGGFPYGITWEEMAAADEADSGSAENPCRTGAVRAQEVDRPGSPEQ